MPTPRKKTPAQMKQLATTLHSRLIRWEGRCRSCGARDYDRLQCAHIIGRSYAWTRTRLDNAFCLCAGCHMRYTLHPDEWMLFVDRTIGRDEYDRLKQLAITGVSKKFRWDDELAEMVLLCEMYDISTNPKTNNRKVRA